MERGPSLMKNVWIPWPERLIIWSWGIGEYYSDSESPLRTCFHGVHQGLYLELESNESAYPESVASAHWLCAYHCNYCISKHWSHPWVVGILELCVVVTNGEDRRKPAIRLCVIELWTVGALNRTLPLVRLLCVYSSVYKVFYVINRMTLINTRLRCEYDFEDYFVVYLPC